MTTYKKWPVTVHSVISIIFDDWQLLLVLVVVAVGDTLGCMPDLKRRARSRGWGRCGGQYDKGLINYTINKYTMDAHMGVDPDLKSL